MNRIAKVLSQISDDMLMHYGVARRSGRYPWGSGDNPYQHSGDFLSRVQSLKKSGMSETDIAKTIGLTTTQLRTQMSLAKDERRAVQVATAKDLREKGYSLNEIADKMGFANDSSVRSLLNENSEARMNQAKATADVLRKLIDEKGMIDVGTGVERELGVSKEKLNQALYILEMEGYQIYGGGVPQVTNPGKQTNIKVICPPGTEHKDIYNYEDVHSVKDYISYDGGESFRKGFEYPSSMDSNRLAIRYKEDGGINKDGVIELRRGVQDLSLGDSHYAQVRIMVDGKKYLKGMAVYSDDMPDGVDVIFNTNKSKSVPKMEVLKDIKNDPDNPFGSLIKEHGGQSYYDDPKGKYTDPVTGKKQSLSLINKRAEEGDWGEWSKTLPSQFLSKQSLSLIKKQLGLATADKQSEFDEICSLTNPTVKKTLLKSFADDCDSAAVHLQAAALPRQKYQVILPLTTIKDNEVYAPNYKDGETVALIRYPHGGTFEIPILKVNNKLAEGKSVLGNTPADAIGINKKNADRLSGADFDGDTVMVIPCNSSKSKVKITSTHSLKGLEDFDTKDAYGPDSSKPVKVDSKGKEYYTRNGRTYQRMTNTQTEMGKISNLITDMTLKGATEPELAKAVRHSIDVSYMSDEEYENCYSDLFNKLEYRHIPSEKLTGEKWMAKSVNIGDQLSQVIGIYYPHRIDTYVKYVRQQKFYGRYMDDWYIMNPSKEELEDLLSCIIEIAKEYGIHINRKKTHIVKISSTYKFLQIKYTLTKDGKVIKRINPKRVTTMRRKLKKLSLKVINGEIEYESIENMFRGWMGAHYKLLSKQQRKNLIQLYEELFNKKISVISRKLIVSDASSLAA